MNATEKPDGVLDFLSEHAKTVDNPADLGSNGKAVIDGIVVEYVIDDNGDLAWKNLNKNEGDVIKKNALKQKITNGKIEVISMNALKKTAGESDTPAYIPEDSARNQSTDNDEEELFKSGGGFESNDYRTDPEELRKSEKRSEEITLQYILNNPDNIDFLSEDQRQKAFDLLKIREASTESAKKQKKGFSDDVAKKKKKGPEDKEDRENLTLRQQLYTATSSDEIKKMIRKLEDAGEKIPTDGLEYQRLRLIESIENDYLGKKVTHKLGKNKPRTGTVTGIQVQTSGLGGYATRIRLVLDNDAKKAVPYEYIVKEGEQLSIADTQKLVDSIDYDGESLKIKGKTILDKNGDKITLQQAVLSEKGQVGFSGVDKGGKTVFVDYHDLFDGLQKGGYKLTVEKDENDDEKISENTHRYIGKFISPDGGKTLYQVDSAEIVESDKDKDKKKLVLKTNALDSGEAKTFSTNTIPAARKQGEKDSDIFSAEKDGFTMINRAEHLHKLNEEFSKGMKADLDKKGSFGRMWLSIKKAFKGQDLETGLSPDTQESLQKLNTYLDQLTTTMADRLKERGYDQEHIDRAKRRYRAKYLASMEVRAERQKLKDEKEEALSHNIVGRGIKWFKKRTETSQGFRRFMGYAGLAAAPMMKGLRFLRGPGALVGAAVGMTVRYLGDKMWADSHEAEKAREQLVQEIESKKKEAEKIEADMKALIKKDPKLEKSGTKVQLRAYGAKLQELKAGLKEKVRGIDEMSGKVNKDRADLAKKYDNGEIKLTEFLKEDERLEKLEIKARLIKRSAAAIAAIGTSAALGGFDIPGLDGFDFDGWLPDGAEDSVDTPEGPHVLDEVVVTPDDAEGVGPEILLEGSESDALAQTGDGVTQIFKRQLDNNPDLIKAFEDKMGMDYESNKPLFLKKMAEEFGYIDTNGDQVRILDGHGAGYQLQIDADGNPSVQEMSGGSDTEVHKWGDSFEEGRALDNYEYPYDKDASSTSPDGTFGPNDTVDNDGTFGPGDTQNADGTFGPGDGKGTPDGTFGPGDATGGNDNTFGPGDGSGQMSPEEALEQQQALKTEKGIVYPLDTIIDKFKDGAVAEALDTQATILFNSDPSDLTGAQAELKTLLMEAKENSSLDPLKYESAEEYLDRVLDDAGAKYSVYDITNHRIFNPDIEVNPADTVDQRPRLSYKDFMDNWFDKDGAGMKNWVLEGTGDHGGEFTEIRNGVEVTGKIPSVEFKNIADLSAREVFATLENGSVTPDNLRAALDLDENLVSHRRTAERLFDFFTTLKETSESNLGSEHITSDTTIYDVLRDATNRRIMPGV